MNEDEDENENEENGENGLYFIERESVFLGPHHTAASQHLQAHGTGHRGATWPRPLSEILPSDILLLSN